MPVLSFVPAILAILTASANMDRGGNGRETRMAMRRPESRAHNSRANSGGRVAPVARSGGDAVPEMPRTGTIAVRLALDAGRNTGVVPCGEVGAGIAPAGAALACTAG